MTQKGDTLALAGQLIHYLGHVKVAVVSEVTEEDISTYKEFYPIHPILM